MVPVLDELEGIFIFFYKEILSDFKRKGKILVPEEESDKEEGPSKEMKRGKPNEK